MAENSPEDAAADTRELKDAVLEALEAKGVLSQVRATLRAAVFTAVDEQERAYGIHVPNQKATGIRDTLHGQLALRLICDFLEHYELDQTLSVLKAETLIPDDDFMSRDGLISKITGCSHGDGGTYGAQNIEAPAIFQLIQRQGRASSPDSPGRREGSASSFKEEGCTIAVGSGGQEVPPLRPQADASDDEHNRGDHCMEEGQGGGENGAGVGDGDDTVDPFTMTRHFSPGDLLGQGSLEVQDYSDSDSFEASAVSEELRGVEEKLRHMEEEDPQLSASILGTEADKGEEEEVEEEAYDDEDFDDDENEEDGQDEGLELEISAADESVSGADALDGKYEYIEEVDRM